MRCYSKNEQNIQINDISNAIPCFSVLVHGHWNCDDDSWKHSDTLLAQTTNSYYIFSITHFHWSATQREKCQHLHCSLPHIGHLNWDCCHFSLCVCNVCVCVCLCIRVKWCVNDENIYIHSFIRLSFAYNIVKRTFCRWIVYTRFIPICMHIFHNLITFFLVIYRLLEVRGGVWVSVRVWR